MSVLNKTIASIISALAVVSVTATVSSAVLVQCKTATIEQAGIVPSRANADNNVSKYVIKATCVGEANTNPVKWNGSINFTLSEDIGDAGYATALTALSTGGTLWLNVEAGASPATWWDNVTGIYADTAAQ